MVKIRLSRVGAKKQPHYRVVVADVESPRGTGGSSREWGTTIPAPNPPTFEVDQERVRYWLSVGAQPTDAVARGLKKLGIMESAGAV